MKSRARVSEEVNTALAELMVEALERGITGWPLPEPAIVDPDFPASPPSEPRDLPEMGLGLLHADKGLIDRHLNNIIDLIVPHRMNLTDDPFEVHERWLLRRIDVVAERLVWAIATDWLAMSLDASAPSSDRWWLAIALIDGLARKPFGQPVHQGYHLVESISLAERPGAWHSKPEVTSASMEWNPLAQTPRATEVVANEKGVEAARWLLTRAENGDSDQRLLCVEWCRLLLERRGLIQPLGLINILQRRASDPSPEIACKVVTTLAKLIDSDRDLGEATVALLAMREEPEVRREMANVLTRLFRRLGWGAVDHLNRMLEDDDESVLAAASATVGDLKFLDQELWADRIKELIEHDAPIVRRNLVTNLREYFETYPDDERGIVCGLWNDGDEVVRTRLRELLLRMEEVSPETFANRLEDLRAANLEPLWAPLRIRHPERAQQWEDWFAGEGEHPTLPETQEIHVSDMSESELPELSDALNRLDELGFID